MAHVFISYSRRDTETINEIVSKLEAAGIEVWLDREAIKAGRQWRKQIVEGIDRADAFILHLSPDSTASVNVMKELNLAEEAQEPFVLPMMLKETQIPGQMRYQLAGTQFIAYYMDPERGFQDLLAEIQKRQGRLAENPIKPPSFREVEVVLENETKAGFDDKVQQKLLKLLSAMIRGTITDIALNYTITRIEEELISE